MFPGQIVFWFDTLEAAIVDLETRDRIIAELSIFLQELPMYVETISDSEDDIY